MVAAVDRRSEDVGRVDDHDLDPGAARGRDGLDLALVLRVAIGQAEARRQVGLLLVDGLAGGAGGTHRSDARGEHDARDAGRGGRLDRDPRTQRVQLPDELGRLGGHVARCVEEDIAALDRTSHRGRLEDVRLNRL